MSERLNKHFYITLSNTAAFTLLNLTGYGPSLLSSSCNMETDKLNEKRDFPRFNGTNFPQWRFGVMLKLRAKKLDPVVLGTETKPNEVSNLRVNTEET